MNSDPRECVIIDTNWLDRMPALRGAHASSLLFAVGRRSAFIGLPETVYEEARKHFVEKGQAAQKKAAAALGELRQVMGVAPLAPQHDADEIHRAFSDRMAELDELVEVLEIDEADYEAAAELVLLAVPPNGPSNQQYKDSLIWQVVKRAASEWEVFFLTADKGFYAGDKALAANLASELERPDSVTIVDEIEKLLALLGVDQADAEVMQDVEEATAEALREAIGELLPQHTDFRVGRLSSLAAEAFLTEQPSSLAVTADFEFELLPEDGDGDPVGLVSGRGSASFDLEDHEMQPIQFESVAIDLLTPHGDINLKNLIYLQPGRKEVYTVRKPLAGGK